MKTFVLTWEQVNGIVVDDLKETLGYSIGSTDEYDVKLVKAIKRVLRHYMEPEDYERFKRELALIEMTRINEELGLYDDASFDKE